MKKWPIALQVYSIRDDAEKDFAAAMAKVKKMGYDGVELAGTYGKTAVELKKILDGEGLELVSAHVPMEDLENDAIRADYAATGLRYIALPWFNPSKDIYEVKACLSRIHNAGVLCKISGMQLLYHNHDFEFVKINGEYILDTYYRELPPDLLQTELDMCWVNVGGEDPAQYLRKYAGRAPIVHLKDFSGSKSENMYGLIGTDSDDAPAASTFEFRPVGYGKQDIPNILEAAEAAGSEWLVVEQDAPSMGRTPMECAELSVRYLHSFW